MLTVLKFKMTGVSAPSRAEPELSHLPPLTHMSVPTSAEKGIVSSPQVMAVNTQKVLLKLLVDRSLKDIFVFRCKSKPLKKVKETLSHQSLHQPPRPLPSLSL